MKSGDNIATVNLTGTSAGFRKQGLASILKCRSMNILKELGYKKLYTMSDSINEPMLNLNNRIGFVRDESAKIIFEQDTVS